MGEESHHRQAVPALNRISLETSWLFRKIAAVVVSLWLGGIVMVSIGAPAAFQAAGEVARHPPAGLEQAWKKVDRDALRDLLRFEAGEANGRMFEAWGTLQVAYGAAALFLLLFFTSVGRLHLGLAAGLLAMALFQRFYLIPAITETGRIVRAAGGSASDLADRFRYLHLAFTAFETAAGLAGLALLVLLLRQRRRSGSRPGLQSI